MHACMCIWPAAATARTYRLDRVIGGVIIHLHIYIYICVYIYVCDNDADLVYGKTKAFRGVPISHRKTTIWGMRRVCARAKHQPRKLLEKTYTFQVHTYTYMHLYIFIYIYIYIYMAMGHKWLHLEWAPTTPRRKDWLKIYKCI